MKLNLCFQRIEAIIVRIIQFYANNIVLTLKVKLFLYKTAINYLLSAFFNAGVQLGGGRGLPCPFLGIEKNALILEKKVLIVSILGLNLPFKM